MKNQSKMQNTNGIKLKKISSCLLKCNFYYFISYWFNLHCFTLFFHIGITPFSMYETKSIRFHTSYWSFVIVLAVVFLFNKEKPKVQIAKHVFLHFPWFIVCQCRLDRNGGQRWQSSSLRPDESQHFFLILKNWQHIFPRIDNISPKNWLCFSKTWQIFFFLLTDKESYACNYGFMNPDDRQRAELNRPIQACAVPVIIPTTKYCCDTKVLNWSQSYQSQTT